MLIEERIYGLHPGSDVREYLKTYEQVGLPVQKRILGGFLGYFVTEFGVQNQLTHLWAYEDLEERRKRREELSQNDQWQECIRMIRPLIATQENKIMYPTAFSPIRTFPVKCSDQDTAFTLNCPSQAASPD